MLNGLMGIFGVKRGQGAGVEGGTGGMAGASGLLLHRSRSGGRVMKSSWDERFLPSAACFGCIDNMMNQIHEAWL